jgi:hypothetical protein
MEGHDADGGDQALARRGVNVMPTLPLTSNAPSIPKERCRE